MLWLVGLRGRDLRGRHGRRGCGLHGLLHRRSLYWHGRFYRRNGLVLVGIRGIRHEMPPVRKRLQPTCRVKEWSRACEKTRSIHRFSSSTSTRSGFCRCWFEKLPDGRSRRFSESFQSGLRCACSGGRARAKCWSVRANGHRNSHCGPTSSAASASEPARAEGQAAPHSEPKPLRAADLRSGGAGCEETRAGLR